MYQQFKLCNLKFLTIQSQPKSKNKIEIIDRLQCQIIISSLGSIDIESNSGYETNMNTLLQVQVPLLVEKSQPP